MRCHFLYLFACTSNIMNRGAISQALGNDEMKFLELGFPLLTCMSVCLLSLMTSACVHGLCVPRTRSTKGLHAGF